MIRVCLDTDYKTICDIINDSAKAYRGVIPKEFCRDPYVSETYLESEMIAGVIFYGFADKYERLMGVMGIQDKGSVCLIRHAYVLTKMRRSGLGTQLINHIRQNMDKPLLVGTWKAASWAISFYQRHGFRILGSLETVELLKTYWSVPAGQINASVVLADELWRHELGRVPSST